MKKRRTTALFDPIKAAALITDRIIVGISGGKDSAVVLEMCKRSFKHVYGYFMYIVPGLSFQERILRYYEHRYDIEILRMPHFMVSEFYRYGTFRPPDDRVPIISTADAYAYVREKFNTWWIAGGERITDSIVRRAMILHSGAIDTKRGRSFPIAYWTRQDVMDYIRINKLKVGEESKILGFSMSSLLPQQLIKIKHHYPDDYERIKRYHPFADVAMAHYAYNPDQYLDKGATLNYGKEQER